MPRSPFIPITFQFNQLSFLVWSQCSTLLYVRLFTNLLTLRESHPVSSLLSVFLIQIACLYVNSSPAQRIHFSQCQLSHHHHCTSHHPLTIIWFPLFPHHSAFNKHCVHLNLSVSSCVCDRCIKSDWT